MEGGRGIDMLHLLASKFNPMDANSVSQTINKLHDLKLDDSQDLSVYFDSLLEYNMQLSWVKQDMSDEMLLWFAQKQLKTSRYKTDVESLEMSHAAASTSLTSLNDLQIGLERLDSNRGRIYGAAKSLY